MFKSIKQFTIEELNQSLENINDVTDKYIKTINDFIYDIDDFNVEVSINNLHMIRELKQRKIAVLNELKNRNNS